MKAKSRPWHKPPKTIVPQAGMSHGPSTVKSWPKPIASSHPKRSFVAPYNSRKTTSPTTTRSNNTNAFENICWKNIPTLATFAFGFPNRITQYDWKN